MLIYKINNRIAGGAGLMRGKIGVAILVSLLLSMLLVPVSIGSEGDKAVIKEMVQAPADYSVSLVPGDYLITGDRYYRNVDDYPRNMLTGYRLYRLIQTCQEQHPSTPGCWECIPEVDASPFLVQCGPDICWHDEKGPWYCYALPQLEAMPCETQFPSSPECWNCVDESDIFFNNYYMLCGFTPCNITIDLIGYDIIEVIYDFCAQYING